MHFEAGGEVCPADLDSLGNKVVPQFEEHLELELGDGQWRNAERVIHIAGAGEIATVAM